MLVTKYDERELKIRMVLAFIFSLIFFIAMPHLLTVVHNACCEVASVMAVDEALNCNK